MKFFAVVWESYEESTPMDSHDVSDTVRFGTKVHGGYSTAGFEIHGVQNQLRDKLHSYLGRHVVIFDELGFRCYEGRIIGTKYAKSVLVVECTGYFEDGANVFNDLIYLAEPAKNNWINNPSFEVNVTDFWSHNANGSVARDTTAAYYGSASLKVTQPSNSSDTLEYSSTINTNQGSEYTFSLFAKKGNIETTPQMKLIQMSSTGGGGSVVKETTKSISSMSDSQWIRYEIYIEAKEPTTQSLIFKITVKGDSAQGHFFVDAVQVEDGQISSYLDGSLGDGYSWSGTAHNSPSIRINMYPYAKDIIFDACQLVDSWNNFTHVGVDGTFDSRIDVDMDFSQVKVAESVIDTLKFGFSNTDFVPAYFVIYDTRTPTIVVERNAVYPDWYLDAGLLSGDAVGAELSLDQVFNKVYAIYDNANDGVSVTVPANDLRSQYRYGVREGLLDNGDTPGGLALAEDLRDTALAKYSRPKRLATLVIKGYARNGTDTLTPIHRIRAGQTAIISDLDTMFAHAGLISAESLIPTNGFIFSTDYNAQNNSMKIDIGSDDLSFEVLMSRLGLSGGLK